MKIVTIAFSLVLSSTFGLAQAPPKPLTPLEQALTANTNTVWQAYKNKDVDLLKRTLTDDFLAVGSEAHLHDKADILESAHEGELKDFSSYNLRVVPVNDDAAIVTYDCIVHMPEGDPPGMAPRYQHISDLWVKQGGEWRLKFEQATVARPID